MLTCLEFQSAKNARDVTVAEAEAALAEDLYKRALGVVKSFERKRMLKSRVAGAKAGYWI